MYKVLPSQKNTAFCLLLVLLAVTGHELNQTMIYELRLISVTLENALVCTSRGQCLTTDQTKRARHVICLNTTPGAA